MFAAEEWEKCLSKGFQTMLLEELDFQEETKSEPLWNHDTYFNQRSGIFFKT